SRRGLPAFGYFGGDLEKAVGKGLRERFEREAGRRGLRPYLRFELQGGTGYRWGWKIPRGGGGPATAGDGRSRRGWRRRRRNGWRRGCAPSTPSSTSGSPGSGRS